MIRFGVGALARIPAAEAGMIYNLFPVIATGMSVFTFGERPTIHLLLALVVATLGVGLVLGQGGLSLGVGRGELAALVMGLASVAAQVLMTEAYGALSVAEAAVWLQLTPIAQVALAVPFLGERATLSQLAGVLLGVAGVAWGTAFGQRRPKRGGV